MAIERLKPALFFDEERLAALRALVPEAFADGKINWSTLKDALGGELEECEDKAEHFGLSWPGKRDARRLAGKPGTGTLVPAKGEGCDEETTRNIYIEGENLEVLKLLRKSYSGRVKMIYIDPPYNTGNDFVYDDDFTEPLQDYLRRTGQIDGEGRPTTTNKKADGRFHSRWLSMMYPRLRLARELLRDDGVIFVSIDDNEVHHLRMLMNEVFGEENFVGEMAIIRSEGGGLAKQMIKGHDYLVIYSKDIVHFEPLKKPKDIRGKLIEKDGVKYWIEEDWLRKEFGKYGTCPYEEIVKYHGNSKKKEIDDGLEAGIYTLIKKSTGITIVGRLRRVDEDSSKFYTVQKHLNANGVEDLKNLGLEPYFDYPKPVSLIKDLNLGCTFFSKDQSDIILDFFSGSATTAHAVLDLNREDGGSRQFVLVQMPEATPADSEAARAGYQNIAEIGKERIRRVIKKIKDEKAGQLDGTTGLDLGFKVYKLARSHYRPWQNYHGESVEKIEELFADAVTPLVPEWRQVENGLLTEIILLEGFPLDSTVKALEDFTANSVVEVTSGFHQHRLVVCLDDRIAAATVESLSLGDNDHFICLDSAVDTQTKTRLADKGQIKTI